MSDRMSRIAAEDSFAATRLCRTRHQPRPLAVATFFLRYAAYIIHPLKHSRNRLQRRQCHTISRLRIIVSIARVDERLLRVNDLERSGLAGLIPQVDQTQALRREVCSAA